jgi:hypothetical protein
MLAAHGAKLRLAATGKISVMRITRCRFEEVDCYAFGFLEIKLVESQLFFWQEFALPCLASNAYRDGDCGKWVELLKQIARAPRSG